MFRLSLACLLAATVACGHDSTPPAGPPPLSLGSVIVTADSTTITINQAVQVRATLRARNGTELQTGVVVWSGGSGIAMRMLRTMLAPSRVRKNARYRVMNRLTTSVNRS